MPKETETFDTSSLHNGVQVIASYVKRFPALPGVYRMVDSEGQVLYVGKAKNLAKRVASYTRPERLPYRIQQVIAGTHTMEAVVTKTEAEALLLEANYIKSFAPRYNILLKDDKSFPYIFLSGNHPFPQIAKHRGERKRKGEYFGPFASAGDVNETLAYLQKIFLLRTCDDNVFASRTRPCLEYQIKRCSAPCVDKIKKEAYEESVREAIAFLKGKSQSLQKKLALLMEKASGQMDYESAAQYRDRIRALTQIQSKQNIHVAQELDADVIGLKQEGGKCCIQLFFFRGGRNLGNQPYFPLHTEGMEDADILAAFIPQFYQDKSIPPQILVSHKLPDTTVLEEVLTSLAGHKVSLICPVKGEKATLTAMATQNAEEALHRKHAEHTAQQDILHAVAERFALDAPIKRIEVYDNSHIMGTSEVGAMIVAGENGFMKHAYRRFTIQTTGKTNVKHGDDYAMMREVFTRRFLRLKKEDPERKTGSWPDLVLIDGGIGQLNTVLDVFHELGVTDVACVAIAKGPERNAGREKFYLPGREPFTLPKQDKVLYYLQKLRDEAHRYAIGSHRMKRKQGLTRSVLDQIQGIGTKRKKALLSHFGSIKAIEGAGIEDLLRVEGINATVAKHIYTTFHSK